MSEPPVTVSNKHSNDGHPMNTSTNPDVDQMTLTQLCEHAKEADTTPAEYYRTATS